MDAKSTVTKEKVEWDENRFQTDQITWCWFGAAPLTRSGTNGYWHYEGAVLSALSAHLFVAGQGPVA